MKKLSLYIFLGLIWCNFVSADSINDIKIEGISVGDSALDYFSEKTIKQNSYSYNNKKFTRVQNDKFSWFKDYDAVDFHFKTGDSSYKIYSVAGIKFYDHNIEECYPFMDKVVAKIKNVLNTTKASKKNTTQHKGDKTGKSTFTQVGWELDQGYIVAICYDYSKEYGNQDHFEIAIDNKELFKFLATDAY